MKTNFKNIKLIAILLLVAVMMTALTGCGLFGFYGEADLIMLMDEMTASMFVGDGISINILLENPEAMGLVDQPATLPMPTTDKVEYETNTQGIRQIASTFRLIGYNRLSTQGKCDRDTVIDYFETYAQYADFYYLNNRDYIGANDGWNVMLPLYLDKLAFKTENDVKNWISLLNQTETAFKAYADFEREVLIPAGYGRSAQTYTDIVKQCEGMVEVEESGKHFLFELFEDKIGKVSFLNEEQRASYKDMANNAIAVMRKAYQDLANNVKTFVSTAPATEKPIANYAEGKKYYELLFKDNASTSDTVEYAYSALVNAFNKTLTESQRLYDLLPDGFELVPDMSMDTLKAHYNLLKGKYTEDFPALPQSIPDATFFTVPDAMADFYNPASYFKSAVDSLSAPETIYVNEGNAGGYLGFDIISHEGIPGHMLQHAYYKSTGANKLRTLLGYTGYVEGWASYAQFYSAKYFEGTEIEKTAYKASCLYDKAMLYLSTMIDIEINYYGRTLAQLQQDQFYSQIFDGSESSIERYNYMVQNPAVYASYGYGNYKMEQLRSEFDGTDLEFHTAVLSVGPTTYEILADHVLGRIEEGRNGSIFGWLF